MRPVSPRPDAAEPDVVADPTTAGRSADTPSSGTGLLVFSALVTMAIAVAASTVGRGLVDLLARWWDTAMLHLQGLL